MNFRNLLNHVWRKPESKPVKGSEKKKEAVDLTVLEHRYVMNVGAGRKCDFCKKETLNCAKVDIAGWQLCICPLEDVRPFRRAKKSTKN